MNGYEEVRVLNILLLVVYEFSLHHLHNRKSPGTQNSSGPPHFHVLLRSLRPSVSTFSLLVLQSNSFSFTLNPETFIVTDLNDYTIRLRIFPTFRREQPCV